MQYKTIDQFIQLIDEPNRSACLYMYEDNKERFNAAPGSKVKHQAWTGGYIHHLEEAMNIGFEFYNVMNSFRPLDFSISDMLLILFLHDLEKPFKYVEPKIEFHSDKDKEDFIFSMAQKYNFELNEKHINALHYIHGEGDDYSPTENIQKPLAAFVHICDTASARIWFDYPKK